LAAEYEYRKTKMGTDFKYECHTNLCSS